MIPNSFTFRQILQIVIPGVYFTSMLISVFGDTPYTQIFNTNFQQTVIVSVISILLGICIYSFDLPKRIWFFKKYLPTENIDKNEYGDYFSFYDNNVSKQLREIIDRYTSLFHLCINLLLISLILIAIYLLKFKCDFLINGGFVVLSIFILSLTGSLLLIYGHKKIKFQFKKQLYDYLKYKQNNP